MSFFGNSVYYDLPRSKGQLSISIIRLAVSLFAATDTGMTGPQMFEFFAKYSDEIAKMRYGAGVPAKRKMFENFIESLPAENQREALLELCTDYGMRITAQPEAVERLRELVQGTAVPESIGKAIETIDSDYVTKQWRKIVKRLNDDPEGAITAARNLVESVCLHILEGSDVRYEDKGDLTNLYKLTATYLALAPSEQTEQVFKRILGSCAAVVQEIATMRNKLSDAHGKGKKAVAPARRHAELAANLAGSMAVFLISSWEAREQ